MADEIERRYGAKRVHALSVSPGAIISRAQRYDDPEELKATIPKIKHVLKSVEQGAATQVWAAVARAWEGKGALYLEDCGVGKETPDEVPMFQGGYAEFAFDEGSEKRLWAVSCELVGVKD